MIVLVAFGLFLTVALAFPTLSELRQRAEQIKEERAEKERIALALEQARQSAQLAALTECVDAYIATALPQLEADLIESIFDDADADRLFIRLPVEKRWLKTRDECNNGDWRPCNAVTGYHRDVGGESEAARCFVQVMDFLYDGSDAWDVDEFAWSGRALPPESRAAALSTFFAQRLHAQIGDGYSIENRFLVSYALQYERLLLEFYAYITWK
jgi:hypothetical protein